ncbi:DUF6957 family protein [Pseudomonas sp. 5Ae-yellow]|uniref:DUF6957 family protein n=1 Tax=Pseudomonas sp. 5Ae-yellow TaxID=2759848 RepID=UPI0015F4B133|nr:hypothetical protein [Pseudomonas sp. 5Ae-yellow]MBA6421522.1 hypothetical protein [Pseudomonas sp. 5Ae-yellow]|tara:strand:- start:13469 stop:13867 length:399 start_codon:yes stop_codon:yes gene_type:complete
MNRLDSLYELIHGPGLPEEGREMSDDEAVAFVRSRYPDAGYCLVRDWIWIDLDMPAAQLTVLEKQRRKPVVLYAHTVIFDSARRWDIGDFVRTSPLTTFSDGFLFHTWNSVYVLLGNGLKKTASLETVGNIV